MVSTRRPFRFPKDASESDCVVKIDIMQKVGSGYLVLKPHTQAGKQYRVVLNENGVDMSCEVEVKPLEGEAATTAGAKAVATKEEEEENAEKASAGKAYMDKKGLLPFVQGVLQVVVKEQPEDPFKVMAKHFLSGYDTSTQEASASPKSPPALIRQEPEAPVPCFGRAEPPEPCLGPVKPVPILLAADEPVPAQEPVPCLGHVEPPELCIGLAQPEKPIAYLAEVERPQTAQVQELNDPKEPCVLVPQLDEDKVEAAREGTPAGAGASVPATPAGAGASVP